MADLELDLTAIALGGMVEQAAVIINELREPLDPEKMLDHLSRLWAAAIGLRPSPASQDVSVA